MILNRTIAPASHPLEIINFPTPQKHILQNGIEVYCISLGDQEVFKLELIFPSGAIHAQKPGISGLTAQMLKRGTKTLNSLDLNESFDYYGAYWDVNNHLDSASVTIYSLCKHLPNLLPLVIDILQNSKIDEQDFQQELSIEIQKNKHNWEKTSFAANQYFRQKLFENDPYGRISNEQSLLNITHNDVVSFYQHHWNGANPIVIISGKITDKEILLLDQSIGQITIQQNSINQVTDLSTGNSKTYYSEKSNALQTSIRFGKLGLSRNNPDYFKFNVLNTVLGGFFGSRLQKNIREEKGFTYGVSSSNVALQRGAYWVVGTDVNKENANQTVDEICKEISLLQSQLISEEELSLVKNYLMGSFIGELTQAFEISEKVKILCQENLPFQFYDQFQAEILACTTEDILQLANKYLNLDEMLDIRVG